PGERDRADDDQEGVDHEAREPPRGRLAAPLEVLGERADEGGGQRALGEQVAEEVRDAERGDERVELAPGAEEDGEDLLADDAEHAARQHGDAHDARPPGEDSPAAGVGRLRRRGHRGQGPEPVPALPEVGDAAERRVALAPKTIGGCGFWTGFGNMRSGGTRRRGPSWRASGSVHSARIAARYSRQRAARSSNGTPRASNSSRSQPMPTPKSSRPPERTSASATCLAV